MNNGSDYFTRGEGSRNFTFGGRSIEGRAPRDDDDESDEDEDEDDEADDEDEEDEDIEEEEEENKESTVQHN